LRERLDEIPALVARGLQNANGTLAASAAFIEVCALRHWPGNVRELLREVQRAAQVALLQGSRLVEPEHLQAGAGERLAAAQLDAPVEPEREDALPSRWSDDEIRRTLAEYDGNVRGTARALGMHRSRLRRWLDKQKSR
jgi:DNA-binding NtrC family response regulator